MIGSRADIAKARRLVVKIGTGVLTDARGGFDRARFSALADELCAVAVERRLLVVSSGAVALGMERLGMKCRPRAIPGKQAAAAVGQSRLMRLYEEALGARGIAVAQVLLTHDDLANRKRYLNARHALGELLSRRVVPVINENDTVSVDELKFGDNDTLASLVLGLVDAELLVILTDAGGFWNRDPRKDPGAKLVPLIERIGPEEEKAAGDPGALGTGGMATKIRAARHAAEGGVATVIAPPLSLVRALRGEEVGTLVLPEHDGMSARKRWIARAARSKGEIHVDDGARAAIAERGKSLLPSGVREVRGSFGLGEPVEIAGLDGKPFARGLAGYSADELRRIAGKKTSEIESILGYKYLDEVVHRDDLVLL